MPTLNPTTSENGRNIRAELYADSYFFLEKGRAFTQTANQKFGVVGSGENSVFRTTAKISFAGETKIFAICQGQIFLQPNASNSEKINLILKPFRQPINGLAIRYIVYRGLQKSDFMDENEEILPDLENSTGYIKHIRKEFKAFFDYIGVTNYPDFKAEYVGFPGNDSPQNEVHLIDDYFFKVSEINEENGQTKETHPFDFPIIPAGTYLGNAVGELGIDIVLNEGDYTVKNDPNPFKLNLSYARASEYELNTANFSGIQKKLIQESAVQFIDIAAFYGLHAYGNGKIRFGGNSEVLKNEDEIYNLIQNFHTKSTVYLYIQSNRQRSYNFYGNYSVESGNNTEIDIKLSLDNTTFTETKFNENWPVWEFPNPPKLAVKLVTDNYSGAGLYVKQGLLNSSVTQNEDYFIRDKNLLQDSDSGESDYTKPVAFNFVKFENNTLSSFIQLIYEGKQIAVTEASSDPEIPATTHYMKDIDDVFGLIEATSLIQPQHNYQLAYVTDLDLLLINFENKTGGQDIATVTTKKVEDQVMKNDTESLQRVTYETLLNNIRQNTGSFFQSRSAYLDNSNSGLTAYSKGRNNFYMPENPYYLQTEVFTGSDGNTITGLSLQVKDGTLPSKKLLGITKDENDKFLELINDNQLNNPKFYFKNELEDEESYYTSSEGTEYRKYSLCIIGENQDGELECYEPDEKVFVTTIDNCVFASEGYGKWVPKMENKDFKLDLTKPSQWIEL